jgi:anthranilate/para-aminobenzoate synthase component II
MMKFASSNKKYLHPVGTGRHYRILGLCVGSDMITFAFGEQKDNYDGLMKKDDKQVPEKTKEVAGEQ